MLQALKRIPIWLWFAAAVGVLFLFGETKISVGDIQVGGENLGGFEYDSSKDTN